MSLPNAFDAEVTQSLLARLERLTPDAQPRWERLNAAEMMTHCAVAYALLLGDRTESLSFPMKVLNRWVFKWKVVSARPYPENGPTPTSPVSADAIVFETERATLSRYIRTVHAYSASDMEGRKHPLFGPLGAQEWSTLFWKHLDHHLRQFGV